MAKDEAKQQIKVSALKQGTVVDHLKRGTALRAVQVLNLNKEPGTVTIGINLDSRTYGAKDLIKIENRELTKEEVNQIALLSPDATFSIIRDFKVVEKRFPELPEVIVGLVNCTNPQCVTNHYDDVTSKFIVLQNKPVKVRCHYCERIFSEEDIDLR